MIISEWKIDNNQQVMKYLLCIICILSWKNCKMADKKKFLNISSDVSLTLDPTGFRLSRAVRHYKEATMSSVWSWKINSTEYSYRSTINIQVSKDKNEGFLPDITHNSKWFDYLKAKNTENRRINHSNEDY